MKKAKYSITIFNNSEALAALSSAEIEVSINSTNLPTGNIFFSTIT